MQPSMKDLMRLVENAAMDPASDIAEADESSLPIWRLVQPTKGLSVPLRFHHAATPDEAAEVFASRIGPKQWSRVTPEIASLTQVRVTGKLYKYEAVFTTVDRHDGETLERKVEILFTDATTDFQD